MSEDIVPVRRMKRADREAEQKGTTGRWSEQSHKWLEEQIEKAETLQPNIGPKSPESIHDFTKHYTSSGPGRGKPEFIIIDDMEDDVIDTTASEIPKELEHHDHRD